MKLQDIYKKSVPLPYSPTFNFKGGAIDGFHRLLMNSPLIEGTVKINLPIQGSLRREDAAKIYELAYFSEGDVLDIGTNHGLSASILSDAIFKRQNSVTTIDLDEKMASKAKGNFNRMGITNIFSLVGDAANTLLKLKEEEKKFSFVFVDHSHEYEPVRSVCAVLSGVMAKGSYVAFHDFVDKRNADRNSSFDVPSAVIDGLSEQFEFVCLSGCTGVYRLRFN